MERLKAEIEDWAIELGQEHVAIEICKRFFIMGGNGAAVRLSQIENNGIADWRAINNNRQQIFRWLRGDSKAAKRKIQALEPAMLEALPVERRARIDSDTMNYLLSVFLRNASSVLIAVLLNDRDIGKHIQAAHVSLDAIFNSTPKPISHDASGWRFR
ncbi:toxin YdaT family protein [Pectobacterium brasiliense]|uniref:toxin YdaT family protein n=1 Tax=Pectobacterium brasiliense TaxID=180957 RepID=UPI002A7FBE19|nr:toxin YdaT family protein [Pectobacterium brasiliense]MDY4367492.1 toxin YdaT family protein [Pectobacterium brasiliense]MDY7057023.1 toxin YdaT family protein [Pectobacterium brasiliense]